ncbi:MAG: gamma-glutamyltransferase [Rhodospirillaceae bacterium]|jgi:gamma-glutamyltranspeptidase / glutathione hydrolase|nr:gamma-glutamyltransferase [Rhodospirillaceae bacterium]MBT5309018.1 gamma-glutamyltransferase [Rhodospirillaceae bacterium]MBT6406871.1 gamma-glutamyltransferase [Rhodospirillaceae bacterium]MBT7355129.1 gamma-glutamyltransferase [Rhodospirillaceae bacterium]
MIFIQAKGKYQNRFRQIASGILVAAALTACESMSEIGDDFAEMSRGLVQYEENMERKGFVGGIAADEPQAALAGREALDVGGNAFDAATAIYFNLAVTMPSSASIGGGGVCLTYDASSNTTRALDFLSRTPGSSARASLRPTGVPGNVLGFQMMHAAYGRLPWSQLVAPAEGKARFGSKVSRAFDADLKTMGAALLGETGSRRVFSGPNGLIREGEKWLQPALANILGDIRANGSAALYKGVAADRFAAQVTAAGGSLMASDLKGYRPVWRETIELPLGDISVHFAPPTAAAGTVAAEIWAMMNDDKRYRDADPEERPHLFVEAATRAYADRAHWLNTDGTSSIKPFDLVASSRIAKMMSTYNSDTHTPIASYNPMPVEVVQDPAATTFVVMDRSGSAVSCALTMNGLFGSGIVTSDSGVLLASVPGSGGRGPLSLGPILATDHFTRDFFFAGAASGGVTAATSLISVIIKNLVDIEDLEKAMARKRLHHSGAPDLVYYEQGYDEAGLQSLLKRGHRIAATPSIGRVNAVGCTQGLPYDPLSCQAVTDPRGSGLGTKLD